MSGPDIRERLAVVETEIKFVRNDLTELKTEVTGLKGEVNGLGTTQAQNYEKLKGQFMVLNSTIDSKLRGSLSGKEKAAIVVALITGVSGIIIACLK
jgi:uncharacterized protein involved in exopolysaccharide biosynthesis